MKIGIIGDLHLNEWSDFSRQVKLNDITINSRLLEQYDVLKQIFSFFEVERPDLIVFMGDIFHRVTHQTLYVFRKLEKMMSDYKVIFLVGNHDLVNEVQRITYLDYLVSEKCETVRSYKLMSDIAFVSYYRNREVLNKIVDEVSKQARILFTHNILDGYTFRSLKLKDGIEERLYTKFDVVINGHYHDFDSFVVGKTKVLNVGAIQDFSFADSNIENEKGVFVYDVDRDKLKKYKLKYKKFIKVSSVEEAKRLKDEYYVRLDIKVDEMMSVKEIEENVKVRVLPKKREVKVMSIEEALEEVISQYKNKELAREFINALLLEVK